jgi:hypothetical protein
MDVGELARPRVAFASALAIAWDIAVRGYRQHMLAGQRLAHHEGREGEDVRRVGGAATSPVEIRHPVLVLERRCAFAQ